MENRMEWVYIGMQMEQSMKANGEMISSMVLERNFRQMAPHIQEFS